VIAHQAACVHLRLFCTNTLEKREGGAACASQSRFFFSHMKLSSFFTAAWPDDTFLVLAFSFLMSVFKLATIVITNSGFFSGGDVSGRPSTTKEAERGGKAFLHTHTRTHTYTPSSLIRCSSVEIVTVTKSDNKGVIPEKKSNKKKNSFHKEERSIRGKKKAKGKVKNTKSATKKFQRVQGELDNQKEDTPAPLEALYLLYPSSARESERETHNRSEEVHLKKKK
jgi:hypothetical protein